MNKQLKISLKKGGQYFFAVDSRKWDFVAYNIDDYELTDDEVDAIKKKSEQALENKKNKNIKKWNDIFEKFSSLGAEETLSQLKIFYNPPSRIKKK